MYFSLAVAAMALGVACGVEWLNVKVEARKRRENDEAREDLNGKREGSVAGVTRGGEHGP